MELIKKNLGLIIYTLVCLVLAGVLGFYMRRAAAEAADYEEKVIRQKNFFEKIRRNDYTLSRENVNMAEENAQLVKQRFIDLRQWLAKNYAIPPEVPTPTSLECVEILKRELTNMEASMRGKGVMVDSAARYFSFQATATAMNLPPGPRVPAILRHIKIVKEVVRIIGDSEIVRLTDIRRPMSFQVKKEDFYTVTPLAISVVATPADIQDFINRMQQQSRFLFFLRNCSFKSDDQAPRGVLKKFASLINERQQRENARNAENMGRTDMSEPDPFRTNDFGQQEMMGRVENFRQTPGEQENGTTTVLTKAELKAFTERLVNAQLNFELIEFIPPDEEQTVGFP